ncbi:methionine ABC transporter ATP-binding protein [Aquibacillus sp. 3ASR75-11]|uniref:Methionine ABC transporter ATP-binding protein n=1 Tax=Terrihalobacillus insolitus TaxID=2950438 RepID=A0A9X3WP62_9BACI|nr:methionine ABC transporter ATP-binding protein [Terrihalobacillus insolitus]MDC3411952.1 methionine ABC transporter ATP-binding protein [Terrihalobacillus insolitus]MDC3423362.1 methionine ABC transporter ATP-binding protein [Terrihalobacillus insolitus]
MIRFEGVSKQFQINDQVIQAIDNVDLTVEKGEIYGVIGFSGAGKSTLIRCVNLLETPSSGKVWVNDQDIQSLSKENLREMRRKIGMIFQHFHLLESKTVFDNIGFPLSLAGEPKSKINKKVKELLDFVGLSDKANHYPDQLSGGQKQRVGIARALSTSPEILLCDEATSALDPQTTQSILDLLKRIQKEYNITILMITHEMQVIREICDRVAVMELGKIIEEGTIFDVFSNPQHVTTRNFVKTVMNDEIPSSIIRMIESKEGTKHIYRLLFEGNFAGDPILSMASKNHDVHTNILFGQITELQGKPFGNLIVEFRGEDSDIHKALEYIRETVGVKELNIDGC